jgi:hypothetical protein
MTAKGQAQRFLEAMEPAGPAENAAQGWKHTPFSAGSTGRKRPYAESVTDFVMSIVHMVREGGRWLELIDAVGAPEILLIGRGHDDKYGENDAVDHKNAPPSAAILEENFQKDYRLVDIAKTTRDGDDDVFRKMKELLLMPDLHLKETCHRLSGLYQLIDRLGGIEEGLGLEDEISPTHGEFVKPKTNQKFDLLSSWSCEIEQRIRKVLRKADSEQEDEDEVEHLASRIIYLLRPELERRMKESESENDVEETFSNEANSEEICQSNTGEQNGEVDEDFCINFLTDEALRMFDLD